MVLPFNHVSVLDAVLRKSWCLSHCAHWESDLGWQRCHGALVASRLKRNDHPCLSCKALGASINQSDLSRRIWLSFFVKLNDLMNSLVDPSPCFNIVKAGDDDLEVFVELNRKVLNHLGVGCDSHSRNSVHHEFGCDFSLEGVHIFLSEQELPVEVG